MITVSLEGVYSRIDGAGAGVKCNPLQKPSTLPCRATMMVCLKHTTCRGGGQHDMNQVRVLREDYWTSSTFQ